MGDDGMAAAARRRQEHEEEEMTSYSPEELNQYEFKIVRSLWGGFDNPARFRQLLQEEAQSGWDLVEKLDSRRVRFKRPIRARERDAMLPAGVDPYRSYFGMKPRQFAFAMFGLVIGVFLVTFLLVAAVFGLLIPAIFHP